MTTASALAVALDKRTAAASVEVVSYPLPGCTASSTGGVAKEKNTKVTLDICAALPLTLSFEAFLTSPCPSGQAPQLTVYTDAGCSGTPAEERGLTPSSNACIAAPGLGGKSAILQCKPA